MKEINKNEGLEQVQKDVELKEINLKDDELKETKLQDVKPICSGRYPWGVKPS